MPPIGRWAVAISLQSEVLRAGKTAVVTNVHAEDEHGFVVGGIVRSAALIPEGGPPPFARPARLISPDGANSSCSFDTWLDALPAFQRRGDRVTRDFRNPWGIMHGGVTSAVIDAVARAIVGADHHVDDVVIHFVAPARVGPVAASVTVLGTRPDGALVRVDVRDQGSDDRTVAFAVATVGV